MKKKEIILGCINKLKENIDNINKTSDFIIFLTYHDIGYERGEELMSKTVDKDLLQLLSNKFN